MQPITCPSSPRRVPSRLAAALALLVAAGCGWDNLGPAPPPLSRIEVAPAADTVRIGSQASFTATAYDLNGRAVPFVTFTWTSSDPAVMVVDASGRVTARSEGVARLRAESGGQRDSASVYVVPAQTGWAPQTSNLGTNLNGVFFDPGGRRGWAVGDGGRIIATVDAGARWSPQVSRTAFSLRSVWFTSANEGWAVGDNGTIRYTQDGGATWSIVASNAAENLYDVCFASRDTGWVVGSSGLILRTFDRGATWRRQLRSSFVLRGVSFAGSRDGWAVGDGGTIVGTHDRGLSWFTVLPAVTGLALKSVWRRSEARAVAVGNQGVVPRTVTTPDSTAWRLGSAGANHQLEGVCFPTDAIGYAVGFNVVGIVLRSDDGGASWQAQASNTQFRLRDVFFVDAMRGWAVGEKGTILHTASGGLP